MAGGRLAGLPESPHRSGSPGSPHTPHAAALAWDAAVCNSGSEDTSPCRHRKRPALSPAGTCSGPRALRGSRGVVGSPSRAALQKGTEKGVPRPPRRMRQPRGPERHSDDSVEASSLHSEPGDTRCTLLVCHRPPCRDGRGWQPRTAVWEEMSVHVRTRPGPWTPRGDPRFLWWQAERMPVCGVREARRLSAGWHPASQRKC